MADTTVTLKPETRGELLDLQLELTREQNQTSLVSADKAVRYLLETRAELVRLLSEQYGSGTSCQTRTIGAEET